MAKKSKPMTVTEAGKRGGEARATKHTPAQLSEWAKKGGWPKGKPRKQIPTTKKDHDGSL